MLMRRIVPCLDVRDGRVVKGVRFADHIDVGEIETLAARYAQQGADELVFYDITASPGGRAVDHAWVRRVARVIDIPFCVAGGIASVDTARAVLHAGADKISINSPALARPALINELVDRFGQQCVVIGIDSRRDDDGVWRVRRNAGDPSRMSAPGVSTLDWVAEVVGRGAGEIVLNAMDSDGVRNGFDIVQLRAVREICPVPLVASGGAGCMLHFAEAFEQADCDAALAASVFHAGTILIPNLKSYLLDRGLPVRSPQAGSLRPVQVLDNARSEASP